MFMFFLVSKFIFDLVNCDELVKQTLESESELGESMRPYADRGVRSEYQNISLSFLIICHKCQKCYFSGSNLQGCLCI